MRIRLIGLAAALLVGCPAPQPEPKPSRPSALISEAGHFCLREGAGHNCLLRDNTVAAHLLATSGKRARLVVAFPAENSGTAFWAETPGGGQVRLDLEEPIESFADGPLRGVRFQLRSSAPLRIEKIVLGNVRLIRDYHHDHKLVFMERVLTEHRRLFATLPAALRQKFDALGATPDELAKRAHLEQQVMQNRLIARGKSLDGKHRFLLELQVQDGGRIAGADALLLQGRNGSLRLQVEAASTYPPYRGLSVEELLRPAARDHLRRLQARRDMQARCQPLVSALRSLALLSTDRKFLAGSWRFLTYFGRDTLMSLWLLRPALAPEAIESGLQAVLDRLSSGGEVAHEESLGDQAVLERLERWDRLISEKRFDELQADLGPLGQPVYDYKMIDGNFMVAPLLDAYLDDESVTRARVAAFLGRRSESRRSNLQALSNNLAFVLRSAAPYAESGQPVDLVALKSQHKVGDWRDSEEGLGFGRYASSVNAYLVPAALRAAQRILKSPKIDRGALEAAIRQAAGPALRRGDLQALLDKFAFRWAAARRHFEVRLKAAEARERLGAFLRSGAPAEERPLLSAAILSVPEQDVIFDALSLNKDGSPVEVMHTDDGFALLAEDMPAEELSRRLRKYEHRYPLGLDDLYGIYVANPALSGRPSDWSTFDRGHYHGTVVWSWQLTLLERGLMRQLERWQRDKAGGVGAQLTRRIRLLLDHIAAAEERVGRMRASELWTVQVRNGRFEPMAYGQASGHADESNALQLWSDLNLAVDLERTRLGLLPPP